MRLQVECDHVQEHKTANSSISCLIEVIALLEKDLNNEVKRSQLWKVDLHGQGVNHSLVTIFPVEANVRLQACLFVFELQDRNNADYFLNILSPLWINEHFEDVTKEFTNVNFGLVDEHIDITSMDGKLRACWAKKDKLGIFVLCPNQLLDLGEEGFLRSIVLDSDPLYKV